MVDPQTFKAGMRRLASGIALVTTRHAETNYGLAATSVSALTAEPPTLLVCINRSASCHDAITASGRYEARLLDGCRDAGLSAFDPVAWSYGAGRLTLVARRGHEVQLVSEREGRWRRDPEVGATLVLRKAR